MSKENVIEFFTEAAKQESLKEQLKNVNSQDELVDLGKAEGYEFSSEHVEEAIIEFKQKPGFFRMLAEAALEIFSPAHDDYPATGTQAFSGDPYRDR